MIKQDDILTVIVAGFFIVPLLVVWWASWRINEHYPDKYIIVTEANNRHANFCVVRNDDGVLQIVHEYYARRHPENVVGVGVWTVNDIG